MEFIKCKITNVRIDTLKTNGGKGRVNKIDIYNSAGVLVFTHHLTLQGLEIESYKRLGNKLIKC